jgi:triacylglycerol esterase/lipase EstA (alpha/beta hydrolase family)
MSADAIHQVTLALRARLEAALQANNISGEVYVGPLDEREASGKRIVLFLYRIAVNASLRNTEHTRPAPAGATPIVHDGALPLDLCYLVITPEAQQTGGDLTSLRALGCAIQALNDAPNLVGVSMGGETARLTVETLSSEEMSRVWSLFPTVNYRTSFAYVVSPVWIDPARPRDRAAPVTREPHRVGALG